MRRDEDGSAVACVDSDHMTAGTLLMRVKPKDLPAGVSSTEPTHSGKGDQRVNLIDAPDDALRIDTGACEVTAETLVNVLIKCKKSDWMSANCKHASANDWVSP